MKSAPTAGSTEKAARDESISESASGAFLARKRHDIRVAVPGKRGKWYLRGLLLFIGSAHVRRLRARRSLGVPFWFYPLKFHRIGPFLTFLQPKLASSYSYQSNAIKIPK